jgi:hypothetical protein
MGLKEYDPRQQRYHVAPFLFLPGGAAHFAVTGNLRNAAKDLSAVVPGALCFLLPMRLHRQPGRSRQLWLHSPQAGGEPLAWNGACGAGLGDRP